VTNLTLDTNILFYAFDPRDLRKHLIAKRVVEHLFQREATIALQCLSELYNAATRKSLAPAVIVRAFIVDLLDNLAVEPATAPDLIAAISLHVTTGYQYFDCVLLATTARMGVNTLLTEDMQHLRQIGSVTVVNPFILTVSELDRVLA
jgi:predicted nucleic acid-binding protein